MVAGVGTGSHRNSRRGTPLEVQPVTLSARRSGGGVEQGLDECICIQVRMLALPLVCQSHRLPAANTQSPGGLKQARRAPHTVWSWSTP